MRNTCLAPSNVFLPYSSSQMLTLIYLSLTTPNVFIFMLCYKNGVLPSANPYARKNSFLGQSGGLAREMIRDALSPNPLDSSE